MASELTVVYLSVICVLRPQEPRVFFIVHFCLCHCLGLFLFSFGVVGFCRLVLKVVHDFNKLLVEKPCPDFHNSPVQTDRVSPMEIGLVVQTLQEHFWLDQVARLMDLNLILACSFILYLIVKVLKPNVRVFAVVVVPIVLCDRLESAPVGFQVLAGAVVYRGRPKLVDQSFHLQVRLEFHLGNDLVSSGTRAQIPALVLG